MGENVERRKSQRIKISWPVNILVDGEIITGETVDASRDGLHINCDEPVPMNEIIEMTIAPPERDLIRLKAKVIWSDLDGIDLENRVVGMGLCLIEISDEDRFAFEAVLEAYSG